MSADIINELIKLGILGPILGAVSWYVWKLHTDLRISENKRAEAAEKVVGTLITINDKWQETFASNVDVIKSSNTALIQINGSLKDVEEVLRDVSQQGRTPSSPRKGI